MNKFLKILLVTTSYFISISEIRAQDKTSEKTDVKADIYDVVEEEPEFPGGKEALYKFIGNNFKYPAESRAANSQGKVYVSFVIDKKGKITDVKIVRGVDEWLDAEAIRVVKKMPKWKPGKQRGKKVKVRYTLPIICKLN